MSVQLHRAARFFRFLMIAPVFMRIFDVFLGLAVANCKKQAFSQGSVPI